MAVSAPMLSRQTIFGCKSETTTGTAEALTAAECVFNAYNHQIRATIPRFRRPGQGTSLGQLPQVPGSRMGEITVETDLCGAGAAGQPQLATPLLLSAGFSASSGTYTPQSGNASYTTITAAVYQDGRFKSIAGAVSDLVIRGTAGGVARMFWRIQGIWQAPTATALVTPTWPTVVPPRVASATFTIGGTAYKLGDFELALNNVITPRLDGTTVSGFHSFCVSDHDYTFRCNLEAATANDFYATHLAGTEAALVLTIGSASNNTIAISAPKMQLMDPPQDVDAGGVIQDQLMYQLNRSAAAGEDSLQFVFS